MRFQVPQFVDIEDRILGPLTLKQFVAYLVAVLVLAPLYLVFPLPLFIAVAIPIFGIAVLFAHARFYGQPFGSLFINGIMFYSSGRLWLWRRGPQVTALKVTGQEYVDYALEGPEPRTALNMVEQMLETAGTVTSEDAEDPMLTEKSEIREGMAEIKEEKPRVKRERPENEDDL